MHACGALPRELWCDEADSVDEVDSGWYDEVGYDDWYDEVDSDDWYDEVDSGSESSGHVESEEYSSSSGVQKASIKQACSVDRPCGGQFRLVSSWTQAGPATLSVPLNMESEDEDEEMQTAATEDRGQGCCDICGAAR